ncbi:MAG: cell division protein FtsK [Dehalococcoidia bacterium]|nr:cell division protein FtsK [Dehalococcoidia bacterium]
MAKAGSRRKIQGSSEAAKQFWTSWTTITAIVVVFTAIIATTVYLSWTPITDSVVSGRDRVLTTVSLGIVPIVVWFVALIGVAFMKREWIISKPNLWLSSLGLVALAIGAFSFFEPYDGAVGWFALNGQITLGGQVGDAIIGSQSWIGTLRLFGIFILTVAVASPALAADIALIIGQGSVYLYIMAVVGIKSLVKKIQNRKDSNSETFIPPEVMTPYERTSYVKPDSHFDPDADNTPEPGTFKLPEFSEFLSNNKPSTNLEESQSATLSVEHVDELPEPAAYPDEPKKIAAQSQPVPIFVTEPEQTEPAKFNRYWSSDDAAEPISEADTQPSPSIGIATLTAPETNGGLSANYIWQSPPMELLNNAPERTISEEDIQETADTIRETLAEYGIEVEIGGVKPGPTVTMYGLVPGWIRKYKQTRQMDDTGRPILDESGKQIVKQIESKTRVKVDAILAREKDLALALKTQSIRIETPAMGKSLVGIEVPNPTPSLVTLRGIMASSVFKKMSTKAHLPIALGKGSGGETVTFDLAKMPHLLIAGATGSGKSVCINAIVSCLIKEKSPSDLRLLLVDPKRVELTPYNGIPHLMAPVIVESDQVVGYLKGLIREMLDRYRRMEEIGVRNIDSYNSRMPDRMPYLVVAIDELADLMMTASFDVESSLCRLAQLGRATGIHLIVATQRPSVDVITGLIKANFPSRISFGMTSQVDSRTILDVAGADKLLGKGDMLYLPLDAGKPSRVQNVFISDEEIESLVEFWKTTPWPALPRIDLLAQSEADEDDDMDVADRDRDEMLDKAIELAYSHRKLSTSLLQRRLRVGYPRAARLMDQLEEEGIVGPGDGSKSRDVIISQA